MKLFQTFANDKHLASRLMISLTLPQSAKIYGYKKINYIVKKDSLTLKIVTAKIHWKFRADHYLFFLEIIDSPFHFEGHNFLKMRQ